MEFMEFFWGFLFGWLATLIAVVLTVAGVRGALEPREKKDK